MEPVSSDQILRSLSLSDEQDEDDPLMEFLLSHPNDPLVSMEWFNGPGLSCSTCFYAVQLPTGHRLYVEFGDACAGASTLFLAFTTARGSFVDELFVKLLFESNGAAFGTLVIGSPAPSVSLGLDAPTTFWVEVFMALFEATKQSYDGAWDECREFGVCAEPGRVDLFDDRDYDLELYPDRKRELVEAYLRKVTQT